jgi:hypothetical protein
VLRPSVVGRAAFSLCGPVQAQRGRVPELWSARIRQICTCRACALRTRFVAVAERRNISFRYCMFLFVGSAFARFTAYSSRAAAPPRSGETWLWSFSVPTLRGDKRSRVAAPASVHAAAVSSSARQCAPAALTRAGGGRPLSGTEDALIDCASQVQNDKPAYGRARYGRAKAAPAARTSATRFRASKTAPSGPNSSTTT